MCEITVFSHLLKKSKCFSTYKHRYFWQRYKQVEHASAGDAPLSVDREISFGCEYETPNLNTENDARVTVRRTTENSAVPQEQHKRKANQQKKKHNNMSGSPSVWPNSILYKVQDILSEWDVCLCSALKIEQLLLVLSCSLSGSAPPICLSIRVKTRPLVAVTILV